MSECTAGTREGCVGGRNDVEIRTQKRSSACCRFQHAERRCDERLDRRSRGCGYLDLAHSKMWPRRPLSQIQMKLTSMCKSCLQRTNAITGPSSKKEKTWLQRSLLKSKRGGNVPRNVASSRSKLSACIEVRC